MVLTIHVCVVCLLDSKCGEEPFKDASRLHRGSAASADAQFERYHAHSSLLTP